MFFASGKIFTYLNKSSSVWSVFVLGIASLFPLAGLMQAWVCDALMANVTREGPALVGRGDSVEQRGRHRWGPSPASERQLVAACAWRGGSLEFLRLSWVKQLCGWQARSSSDTLLCPARSHYWLNILHEL